MDSGRPAHTHSSSSETAFAHSSSSSSTPTHSLSDHAHTVPIAGLPHRLIPGIGHVPVAPSFPSVAFAARDFSKTSSHPVLSFAQYAPIPQTDHTHHNESIHTDTHDHGIGAIPGNGIHDQEQKDQHNGLYSNGHREIAIGEQAARGAPLGDGDGASSEHKQANGHAYMCADMPAEQPLQEHALFQPAEQPLQEAASTGSERGGSRESGRAQGSRAESRHSLVDVDLGGGGGGQPEQQQQEEAGVLQQQQEGGEARVIAVREREEEEENENVCRICMEESPPEELVSPCDCRGSMSKVHPACLERWIVARRSSLAAIMNGRGSSLRCEICQVPYRLNIVRPQRFSCSRRAFCSPDALLHLILFLAPFSLIGLSGYAVYVMVRVLLTGPSYAALVWFIAAITVFCLVLISYTGCTAMFFVCRHWWAANTQVHVLNAGNGHGGIEGGAGIEGDLVGGDEAGNIERGREEAGVVEQKREDMMGIGQQAEALVPERKEEADEVWEEWPDSREKGGEGALEPEHAQRREEGVGVQRQIDIEYRSEGFEVGVEA